MKQSTGRIMTLAFVAACCLVFAALGQDEWTSEPASQNQSASAAGTNDHVTVDFFEVTNADVRAVFKQISEFSRMDIVLADGVSGTVTVSVTKKTWKELMMIVCKIMRLTPVVEANYIYVVPTAEYDKVRLSDATTLSQTDDVSPLRREIIQLSNATAAEMQTSIQPLLSARGKITVLQRNNALIVFDTDKNIRQIKEMVKAVDVETGQILISAKIMEVSDDNIRNLGVEWGYFDQVRGVSGRYGSSVNGVDVGIKHGVGTDNNTPAITGTNVVSSVFDKLSFGLVSPKNLQVALEYLFQNNRAEVVAEPSITTLDNKEARIFMGGQIQLGVRDFAGNTIAKMLEVGTELIVTPHITDGKRVLMLLNAKKESINSSTNINTQSATTSVVVNDGETVVIAGLTSNELQESERGIPLLKDIPFIGYLFKTKEKTVTKKNLIIFVTPHIIRKNIDEPAAAK